MKHELIERTAREWVSSDECRAARDVRRLARYEALSPNHDLVEALVRLAGKLHLDASRAW